jgi:uncharacterized protein (DUF2252 family)
MEKIAPTTKPKRKGAAADVIPTFTPHVSREELRAQGKALRETCPLESHATWKAPKNRPDPIQLIEQANVGRMPQLIALRHGRMLQSPFTFYRGSALSMAVDLGPTPVSGIRVQACGDAHLMNFGAFSTPERRVIFSINDLDETLPAPWEWDIKRLAASFVMACRDNRLSEDVAKDVVLACVRAYRKRMAEYSEMRTLDVWYDSIDIETMIASISNAAVSARATRRLAKEKARSVVEQDFPKLAHVAGETAMIKDNLPTIFHFTADWNPKEWLELVREAFALYRDSLHPATRAVLDRFEFKDIAVKVVGVGSVGTVCLVMLLMAGDKDPLFLQVKEARASVLEPYAGKSVFANHGQRVVNGHRLMQSASDMFIGFTQGRGGRHFYFRQLRDVKIKALVELFGPEEMIFYAKSCGRALALSHGRSGEPAMISGYLGKRDVFDQAIAVFSAAYADQMERDYNVLKKAVAKGRLKVQIEQAPEV